MWKLSVLSICVVSGEWINLAVVKRAGHFSLPTAIVVVSRSSSIFNCTYSTSLLDKGTAKCPKCQCKYLIIIHSWKNIYIEHIEIWKIPKTMETWQHSNYHISVCIRVCLRWSSRRTTTLGLHFLRPSFALIMSRLALASQHASQHPTASQTTFLFRELPNKLG